MEMVHFVFCTALLLATTAVTVNGFSSGAPLGACSNIRPIHGSVPPSTSFLPFIVNTSVFVGQTYIPNRLYTIRLHGLSVNPTFRGFMIQGRTVANDSATGLFLGGPNYQPTCDRNTAATHINSAEKANVNLVWIAPPPGTGTIRFRFSFVDFFSLFWVNRTVEIYEAFSSSTSSGIFSTSSRSFSFPTSTSTRFFPTSTRISSTSTRFFPTSTSFFSTSTRIFPTASTAFSSFPSTVFPTSNPTVFPPTVFPPTVPPSTCAQLTGYPPCSPEYCYGKDSLTRCSVTVDSCTERCQITICGACFYINRPNNTQCSRRSYCKDFKCLLQWINCAYKKTVKSQFICMIAAAADTPGLEGVKLPYGKGGLASNLFTIL